MTHPHMNTCMHGHTHKLELLHTIDDTDISNRNSEYSLIPHNLFSKIWWINELDGLTRYSLVLVHYISTGKLWWIKGLADKAVVD